jgi:hypothetical protein
MSDLEEELRHHSTSKSRIGDEYKQNVDSLRQSVEKLTVEKVNFEE